LNIILFLNNISSFLGIGDWGLGPIPMGIGDWGLGIGV